METIRKRLIYTILLFIVFCSAMSFIEDETENKRHNIDPYTNRSFHEFAEKNN